MHQVTRFSLNVEPPGQHPFGIEPRTDALLHLRPDFGEIGEDLLPLARRGIFPQPDTAPRAFGRDLMEGRERIDVRFLLPCLPAKSDGAAAQTVCPAGNRSVGELGDEVHRVGMLRRGGHGIKKDFGPLRHIPPDDRIGAVPPSGRGKRAVQHDLVMRRSAALGKKLFDDPLGPHGVGTGRSSPDSV